MIEKIQGTEKQSGWLQHKWLEFHPRSYESTYG